MPAYRRACVQACLPTSSKPAYRRAFVQACLCTGSMPAYRSAYIQAACPRTGVPAFRRDYVRDSMSAYRRACIQAYIRTGSIAAPRREHILAAPENGSAPDGLTAGPSALEATNSLGSIQTACPRTGVPAYRRVYIQAACPRTGVLKKTYTGSYFIVISILIIKYYASVCRYCSVFYIQNKIPPLRVVVITGNQTALHICTSYQLEGNCSSFKHIYWKSFDCF